MDALQVFIGYDSRQPVAFHVAAHSVLKRAFQPVPITPLVLSKLPVQRRGLTEFTYSRFLVPYLSRYSGYSLFIDSDTLCLGDVYELLAYPAAYPEAAVFVVQSAVRFEWPSVMLFNNERCRTLTPEYVREPSNPLFDFKWASLIGALPSSWNHLVGYDHPNPDAKLIHYTKGVPCWPETTDCEFAREWTRELEHLVSTCSFQELMGQSRHVRGS